MSAKLEQRIAALERQVADLQRQQESTASGREWVDDVYGKFAGDRVFVRAMKLGRKYRQSFRPRSAKAKAG